MSESTVSHRLAQLRRAGFVESDRRGMHVFHRPAPRRRRRALRGARFQLLHANSAGFRDTHISSVLIQPKGSWTTTDPAQRVEVTAYPNRGASVRVETGVRTMFTRRIAITSSAILAPGHFLAAAGVHRRRVRGQPVSRLLGELTVSPQRPRRGDLRHPTRRWCATAEGYRPTSLSVVVWLATARSIAPRSRTT